MDWSWWLAWKHKMLAILWQSRSHFGHLQDLTIAYVGDGRRNNVANSLLTSWTILGVNVQLFLSRRRNLGTGKCHIDGTFLRSTIFQNMHKAFRLEMPVFIRRSLTVVAKFVLSSTRRSALYQVRTDNRAHAIRLAITRHCPLFRAGSNLSIIIVRLFLKRPSVRHAIRQGYWKAG